MKTPMHWLLSLAVVSVFGTAHAQTPTLEFAPGAGNPTGNGPTVASQVITFQNNADNPSSSTFTGYSPATTVTFALSNQKYGTAGKGVMFGGQSNYGAAIPASDPLFPVMNYISGAGNNNADYIATSGLSGGIDVATNHSVQLFSDVQYLGTVQAGARSQYADLTITFSQPTVNPVLHVTGLGSTGNGVGFTTELDLLTAGVTLSELSGSPELAVNATQILNTAANPTTSTGWGAASGSVLVTTPKAGITVLRLRLYLRTGNVAGNPNPTAGGSYGDGWLLGVSALTPVVLSGYVFEDVNYGGGPGRDHSAAGAAPRPGATVELYDHAHNLFSTTTTDATGQYTFTITPDTYTVRVVNSTVTSSRPGYTSSLLPVQTYNGSAAHVGGTNPVLTDAAANSGSQPLAALTSTTATPQSLAEVVAAAGSAGPDFGYNFDTIVNTNDSGQGSLRQFVLNANALGGEVALAQSGSYTNARNLPPGSAAAGLAGVALPAGTESSIFMIPTAQLTNGVAAITTASVLPAITSANLAINGGTQTYNIGNTNDVLLGTGGTVGTAATALSRLNGPEVELAGHRAGTGIELVAGATNVTVRGLSIYGYGSQIGVATDVTGTLIEQNVVGTAARSFSDPGASVRGPQQGIFLYNSDSGQVRANLIGYNGGMGIWVYGSGNGANNNTITDNELRGNAQEVLVGTYPNEGLVFDGLELQGASTGNLVAGNLLTANLGHGIDSNLNGTGGNTITGNTISDNGKGIVGGTGVEGSGLRVYGALHTTTISCNVLSGNNGSGVLVLATADKVLISQNSTFDNTRLGIDLLSTTDSNTTPTTYNGITGAATNVSRNDNGNSNTGGNQLLNFPVITSAKVQGSKLLVAGYARPGVAIELFVASSPASSVAANQGFGQGRTYLGTLTEGSLNDTDNTTGSYAGTINGHDQGTDNTNKFAFEIPLAGSYAGVAPGTVLTSTATLGTATSEFSGTATVASASTIAPLPITLVSFTAQAVQNRDALLNWTTASELHNDHFEIERSLDGVAFAKLGSVSGHGVTATATSYTFTDASSGPPATGPTYYRLRQIDTDGSSTYSPVRSVRFAAEALTIGLAPNPAASTVALDLTLLPAGTYHVCLLDATGRTLLSQQLAAGLAHALPLDGLARGTYLVRVSSEHLNLTKRLSKE